MLDVNFSGVELCQYMGLHVHIWNCVNIWDFVCTCVNSYQVNFVYSVLGVKYIMNGWRVL